KLHRLRLAIVEERKVERALEICEVLHRPVATEQHHRPAGGAVGPPESPAEALDGIEDIGQEEQELSSHGELSRAGRAGEGEVERETGGDREGSFRRAVTLPDVPPGFVLRREIKETVVGHKIRDG